MLDFNRMGLTIGEPIYRRKSKLPGVARHALAGVAAGDVGELALEGGGERKAADEFHFRRGGSEGRVMRRCGAIDDKGCAGQRLKGRRDSALGVEVVRPGAWGGARDD